MTDYTKSTNFTSKDSLSTGNPLKIIKGTEFDTEFNAISTAIATKADLNSPTLVTPALGTPASGVMTNVTGLPLTTGVTGTLPVANGGTGATTLTANNVLLGNGTSALQVVAPGTTGNLLTSDGTTWTSAAPPSGGVTSAVAGNGIAVSAATGAVTFSAAAPTYNSVGSYAMVCSTSTSASSFVAGSNYSAGTGSGLISSAYLFFGGCLALTASSGSVTGTWKWMSTTSTAGAYVPIGIAVRVA